MPPWVLWGRQRGVLWLEPLSSLDANLRASLRVELKHLHEKLGLTFLMVTHDQTEALVMADRVVLMQRGRIAQDGTPTEIYEHPRSAYVANFIGTTNLLRGKVSERTADSLIINAGEAVIRASAVGNDDQAGDDVSICIRPEKARILRSDAEVEGLNALPAVVDELLYHGNSVRVRVHLKSGEAFLLDVHLTLPETQGSLPQKGTQVMIGFDPANTATFPWEGRHEA